MALVVFVAGPIGHCFGITNLYSLINHFIETHESEWRDLMMLLYLVPYVAFGFLMKLISKCLASIDHFK